MVTVVVRPPRKKPNSAVAPLIMVSGPPGHSALMQMALSFFATEAFDADLEVATVELWTRSRMLSVIHRDAVTILHGPSGQRVQPVAEVAINSGKLTTVMEKRFSSTVKFVPMLSLFLTGPSGVPAVLPVVTV